MKTERALGRRAAAWVTGLVATLACVSASAATVAGAPPGGDVRAFVSKGIEKMLEGQLSRDDAGLLSFGEDYFGEIGVAERFEIEAVAPEPSKRDGTEVFAAKVVFHIDGMVEQDPARARLCRHPGLTLKQTLLVARRGTEVSWISHLASPRVRASKIAVYLEEPFTSRAAAAIPPCRTRAAGQ